MILSHSFTVAAPMDAVFDVLTDPSVVDSVPGARFDSGGREGELRLADGSAPLVLRGAVTLCEADREAGALALILGGHEAGTQATAHCAVAIRLRPAEGTTTVSLQLDVDVEGHPATGPGSLEAPVRALVYGLAAALRQRLEARDAPGDDGPTGVAYGRPWPVVPAEPGASAAAPGEPPDAGGDEVAAGPGEAAWHPSEEEQRGLAELVAELEREEMRDHAAEAAAAETAGGEWPRVPAPEWWTPEAAEDAGIAPEPGETAATVPPAPPAPLPTEPEPGRPRFGAPGSPVPGRVQVVTDGPLDGGTIPVGDGPVALVRAATRERPWIIPAAILGLLAVVVLLRRRRRGAGARGRRGGGRCPAPTRR